MRDLPSSITDSVEIQQGSYPIDFVEIYADQDNRFDPITSLRLSTGFKTFSITAGGQTEGYTPARQLLSISSLDETADVKTNSINLVLAGMDSSVVAAIAGVDVSGSVVILYRGYFNTSTGVLADPYVRWKGIVNSYSYNEVYDGINSSVTFQVSCKNIVAALLDKTNGRFTSVASFTNIGDTPLDASMEYVASLENWNPRFGADD